MKKTILVICLAACMLLTACTASGGVEAYNIGTGAHQCFAVIGDSLMSATDTSFRVYDADGVVTVEEALEMKYPTVSENADNAVVYEIGGTQIRYLDGSSMGNGNVIINAALNEQGLLALSTESAGYKGCVTVYSAQKAEVFKWYSADNWVLKAEVSPDGEHLAVLCSGDNGGSVHIFALSGTEETGIFRAGGAVFSDMHWLGDRICCIADDMLYFCNAEAAAKGKYSFDGQQLGSYAFCGDEIVLELRAHSFGGAGTLVAVNEKAKECGRANPESEVEGFDYADGKLLTLCQGRLLCYDESMKLLGASEVSGCEKAFLRTDDILLISAGQAIITDLNNSN